MSATPADPDAAEDRRCRGTIEYGPKRGSGVVYGRRRCKLRVKSPYLFCRFHQYQETRPYAC